MILSARKQTGARASPSRSKSQLPATFSCIRDDTLIDRQPRDGGLRWQSGVVWERGIGSTDETPLLEACGWSWLMQSQHMS